LLRDAKGPKGIGGRAEYMLVNEHPWKQRTQVPKLILARITVALCV